MANLITWLLAIRRAHGANSAVGRHASNLDEIEQQKRTPQDPEQLRQIAASEARQWAALGREIRASTVSRGDRHGR